MNLCGIKTLESNSTVAMNVLLSDFKSAEMDWKSCFIFYRHCTYFSQVDIDKIKVLLYARFLLKTGS